MALKVSFLVSKPSRNVIGWKEEVKREEKLDLPATPVNKVAVANEEDGLNARCL